MDIEFDADKGEVDCFKRRLPLAFSKWFADPFIALSPTIRIGDEEDHWKAIDMVDGKLYKTLRVWREDVIRMISVRRSNASERREYDSDPSGPE